MEKPNRWKILETRQQLIDLLEESKWDLITERYYEASERMDKIQAGVDQLMVELLMNMVDACPGSK